MSSVSSGLLTRYSDDLTTFGGGWSGGDARVVCRLEKVGNGLRGALGTRSATPVLQMIERGARAVSPFFNQATSCRAQGDGLAKRALGG